MSDINTWYDFVLQQMAAESYLDQYFDGTKDVVEVLTEGNTDGRVITDPKKFGYTRMTSVQADDFLNRYEIIDHHANDTSGFSVTLMQNKTTGDYTLSFQ